MPQIFQVLRCFKCLTFQVHQTKKSNKWECKLCGEKQSIKRHYGIGIAKDCRIHVQKLNSMKGELDELKCGQMQQYLIDDDSNDEVADSKQTNFQPTAHTRDSKWSCYVEKSEHIKISEEVMHLGNTEVVLEMPKKKRKQFHKNISENCEVDTQTSNLSVTNQTNNKPYELLSYSSKEHEASLTSISNIVDVKELHPNISSKENPKPLPCKNFNTKLINKNSKWAGYIDSEDLDTTISPDIDSSQNKNIFSLCDDSELDNVLDI